MATDQTTDFRSFLKLFLPHAIVAKLAKHHAFCQRQRKLHPVFFVWNLILGASCATTRSLASLARNYQRFAAIAFSQPAFYKRFDQPLLDLLAALFDFCVNEHVPKPLAGPFKDILALDATILALWDDLAERLPSCQEGSAALKMHLVISVLDYTPNTLKFRAGKDNDNAAWKGVGKWVEGKLLLMDLGYYSFWFFHRIHQNKGFFLTRLKSNCALEVLEDLTPCRGRRTRVKGCPLDEVLKRLKRKRFEFVVKVPVVLRSGRTEFYHWRVLGEWNKETKRYHCYMTNAPEDMILCEDARGLYAQRWAIEVLFRGLKETGRLHELPSRKEVVVKALIYAALLFVMLSMWLRRVLFTANEQWRIGVLKIVRVTREWGAYFLELLAEDILERGDLSRVDLFREQCLDSYALRPRLQAIPLFAEHSCALPP